MAVSSSYDFSVTFEEHAAAVMRVLNLLETGEDPTTQEKADIRQATNMWLKAQQANSSGLWLNQTLTLMLAYNTQSYAIGPSGTHCSATVVKTEVATASAAADKTIVVDSITGISDDDIFGIELDDNTVQWTDVNGTPATATITITTGLTSAAGVDNHVYTYTSLTQRPLEIFDVRRLDQYDNEYPLFQLSRQEYMALNDKNALGPPVNYYYDPQLTDGVLYTWPTCDNVKDRIKFTGRRPIMDLDADANDFDVPQEWLRAMKYNVAVDMAPEFQREVSATLAALAISSLEDVSGFDNEPASITIKQNLRSR